MPPSQIPKSLPSLVNMAIAIAREDVCHEMFDKKVSGEWAGVQGLLKTLYTLIYKNDISVIELSRET